MNATVHSVKELKVISDIISLHNTAWNNSTGIIALLKNSTECFVLMDEAKRVIGYVFIEEDRKRGFVELQDIVVAPASRRLGGGKLLMNAVTSHYPRIKLIASALNTSLIAFYKKMGFREEYMIENYYEIGEDGIRMSWEKQE